MELRSAAANISHMSEFIPSNALKIPKEFLAAVMRRDRGGINEIRHNQKGFGTRSA
jgi:hypothetical protein